MTLFDGRDVTARRLSIINTPMAITFWPMNPIGGAFGPGGSKDCDDNRIVDDVKKAGSIGQRDRIVSALPNSLERRQFDMYVVMRTPRRPGSLAGVVRDQLNEKKSIVPHWPCAADGGCAYSRAGAAPRS